MLDKLNLVFLMCSRFINKIGQGISNKEMTIMKASGILGLSKAKTRNT